ncbi:MAG: flippase [Deltaproteobacteria bacterium]|nr:flippase [Deltaproteobacteria bacterium]
MSLLKKNIVSLFILQGANYLLPLVTVPYLVRVLGPEHFGRIAFAQAFVQYFMVLTDYGFNLSATRSVALVRDNPTKLSNLFSAVMIVKTMLMALGFGLMLLIVWIFPGFSKDWTLYVLVYLKILGSVLFPIWLFQGLEQMRHITMLTILASTIIVVSVFTLVHQQSDYHTAAALNSSGMVIAGLFSLAVIPRLIKVRLNWPGLAQLRQVVSDGWHVFLSTAAISLYTSSNVFFLGLLTNPTAVGYFAASEKLIKAVQGFISPVSQAVYPHVATLSATSHDAALAFIGKLLRLQGAATFALSLLLFFFASPVVYLLLGIQFQDSVCLIEWMAALPFVVGLSNVFGIQTMLNFDMKQNFSRILITCSLINIALIIPLAYWMGAQGAAISVLLTEIIVTGFMAFALAQNGLLIPITIRRLA